MRTLRGWGRGTYIVHFVASGFVATVTSGHVVESCIYYYYLYTLTYTSRSFICVRAGLAGVINLGKEVLSATNTLFATHADGDKHGGSEMFLDNLKRHKCSAGMTTTRKSKFGDKVLAREVSENTQPDPPCFF